MTNFNGTDVVHLDINDFDNNVLVSENQPVKGKWFCMVQGDFCGYCTQAKPEFLKAKDQSNNAVMFCTVQIDGTKDAQTLGKQLKTITNLPLNGGVPCFVLFKDGKAVKKYDGNRSASAIIEFLNNN